MSDNSDDDSGRDDGSGTTASENGPGFGVGGALAGITSAGYLLKRRLGEPDKE